MKAFNLLIALTLVFMSLGCLIDSEEPTDPPVDQNDESNRPDSRVLSTTVVDFNARFEGQGEAVIWSKDDVKVLVGCNQFQKGHTLELTLPNGSSLNWYVETTEPGVFEYKGDESDAPIRRQANPTSATFIPVSRQEGYFTRLVDGKWTITRQPTVKGDDDKYIYQSNFTGTYRDVNPPERTINVTIDWTIEYTKSPTHCRG